MLKINNFANLVNVHDPQPDHFENAAGHSFAYHSLHQLLAEAVKNGFRMLIGGV